MFVVGYVNVKAQSEAVVFQRTVVFFPAVTVVFRGGCLVCLEEFSVVLLVCAAITKFYVVFVENLAVPVIFRRVFADEFHKLSVDVCLYVHSVRWIKPNYVSLAVLASILRGVSCWFLAFGVG